MARSETIALIEFAPGRRGAVGGGGRVAIGARGCAIEHGRFARRRTFGELRLRGLHFAARLRRATVAAILSASTSAARRSTASGMARACTPAAQAIKSRVASAASARAATWSVARRTQNHFHKSVLPLSSCAEP